VKHRYTRLGVQGAAHLSGKRAESFFKKHLTIAVGGFIMPT
jgi:hypothetical protein